MYGFSCFGMENMKPFSADAGVGRLEESFMIEWNILT